MKRQKYDITEKLSPSELAILSELQSGRNITEAFAPMIKRIMEAALNAEMQEHLATQAFDNITGNRRNGKSRKQVKSAFGSFELETPRDREGSFEPLLVPKRQRILTGDLDQKILGLYGIGTSYADIKHTMQEAYGVDICETTLTKITDQLLPEIQSWQQRPLQEIYPIVFLDVIHFKIREDGRVVPKAVYTLLAIDKYGHKDILGLYISDTESSRYWSQVLASLKERGLKHILIACTDGLKGFGEAIHAHFPDTELQLCVVHQIRNSLRYVASKDQREFIADLKPVYRASDKEAAEDNLLKLEEKWGKKYPSVIESWHRHWDRLSAFFKYSPEIRKIIYTTNPVEGLHRMVRKYTKSKGAFTSENALAKAVFCAHKTAMEKWSMPLQNWAFIIAQLSCHFQGRF